MTRSSPHRGGPAVIPGLLWDLHPSARARRQKADGGGDRALTARLRAAFHAVPLLRTAAIHISTARRIVRLTGTVESEQQRSAATAAAVALPGVAAVRDLLILHPRPEPSPAGPTLPTGAPP